MSIIKQVIKYLGTYIETIGNRLNDLLENTYDAEKGYKKAIENMENANLKGYFEQKSQQRYDFRHQLKLKIKSFGQEVDKGDSATSKAHRA